MDGEVERKRACAGEREAFQRLMLMANIADEVIEELERRSKAVPGIRRDLGLLASLPLRIYNKLLETVPEEQIGTIQKNAQNASYTIGTRALSAARKDEFGIWISHNELEIILNALRDHCLVCDKEGKQQYGSCPLKKALDIIGTEVDHSNGCGYFTAW